LLERPTPDRKPSYGGKSTKCASTPIEVVGNTMGLGGGNLVKLKRPLAIDGQYSPFWTDADFDKEVR
jgi:hypothetical protein